jgi:DNA invertase Pin-like site-specific DNA recombinase
MRIGYGRISTKDQDLAMQKRALQNAGCERLYLETASGAQHDRPKLKLALEAAQPGDIIIVWKLDRLARSLKQLLSTVEELKARQIGFCSITEYIDTTSPAGMFTFQIFGAVAEFERSLIRERTIAGLAHARSLGKVGGRPKAMTDRMLTMAKALIKDSRLNMSEVPDELGVSTATLYRYLPGGRGVVVSDT